MYRFVCTWHAQVAKMGVAAVTGLSGEGSAGAAHTYISDPHNKVCVLGGGSMSAACRQHAVSM